MTNSSVYQGETVRICFFVPLVFLIVSVVGCSRNDKKEVSPQLPQDVLLEEYFPFSANSHWKNDWHNNRGDSWQGSLTVTSSRKNHGLNVLIVIDSTESYAEPETFRSAYLWDKEGLKHLYPANLNGDSVAFMPPRLVLPANNGRRENILT